MSGGVRRLGGSGWGGWPEEGRTNVAIFAQLDGRTISAICLQANQFLRRVACGQIAVLDKPNSKITYGGLTSATDLIKPNSTVI